MLRTRLTFTLLLMILFNEKILAQEELYSSIEEVQAVAEVPSEIAPAPELQPTNEPLILRPEEIPPPPVGMPVESSTRRPAIPLEEQNFVKKFEFEMGTTFLPYDALYKPMLVEASMQWEFARDWIWEIGRFGWAVSKFSSGLREQVYSDLRQQLQGAPGVDTDSLNVLEGDEMKHLRFIAGGSIGYRLFQGKVSIFRKKDFQHEWILKLGGMYLNMKRDHQAGPTGGVEMRFRFNENFDTRLNVDQMFGVMMKSQNSVGIFGLGFGYRF